MRTLQSELIRYRQYIEEEAKKKPVVFTFGRFNPVTGGHEIMVDAVISHAKKKSGQAMIFTSQTQDKKKNPLSYKEKIKYLKIFWGKIIKSNKKVKTAFDALRWLSDAGYKDVTMVVGSDRVADFEKNIRPYIKHKDKSKSYDFDHFEVIQAGVQRGADNIMSASIMRAAAVKGDYEAYKKGMPSGASDKVTKEIYDAVRKGLGIREEYLEFGTNKTTKKYKEFTPGEDAKPHMKYPTTAHTAMELKVDPHHKGTHEKEKLRDVLIPKKLTHAFKRMIHKKRYVNALKIYNEMMKEYKKNPEAMQQRGAFVTNPKGRMLQKTAEIVGVSIGELKKVLDRETRYASVNMEKNRPFSDFIKEEITKVDLAQVEAFADKIFAKVGIDVEFTKHFLQRANDKRNGKDINVAELTRLFKQTYKKHGKKIPQLGKDAQAVLNDTQTELNLPFVLKWDEKNKEFDLVSKTIMRKKDFKTSNPKLKV